MSADPARVRAALDAAKGDTVTLRKDDLSAALTWWQHAGTAAWWAWHEYDRATTPTTQASYLIELSNRMFDLSTYLPGFDPDLGRLRYDDEDVEHFETVQPDTVTPGTDKNPTNTGDTP